MENTNMIQAFHNAEFGDVRVLKEAEDKYLFCASDVAKALGYSNAPDVIRRHCRCIVKRDIPHPQTNKRTIEMIFIPEGDVYRLIVHSKLPSAQSFEKWIFEELLPTIRKYGAYMTDSVLDQVKENPELIYNIADALVAEREKSTALEGKLRIAQPKADYFDAFVNQEDLVGIRVAVKELASTREKQLINILIEKKYLYRGPDERRTLLPTADAVAKGFFVVKEVRAVHSRRKRVPQTFFTPKGLDHVRLQIEKGKMGV